MRLVGFTGSVGKVFYKRQNNTVKVLMSYRYDKAPTRDIRAHILPSMRGAYRGGACYGGRDAIVFSKYQQRGIRCDKYNKREYRVDGVR
jgi:hypothetical protein